MKITTFFICMAGLMSYACTGGERPVTMEQLPSAARQFVAQHFEGLQIAHVTEDADLFSKSYDLWFVNGDKIEFEKSGNWDNVDCSRSAVPTSVLPLPIVNYLAQNYPAATVKKIDRDKRGCEVKLDNGLELKFDKQYNLLKIDD